MIDYIAMGQRIKMARNQKYLTQAELAERTGISASFLGHVERGSRVASLETIVALAEELEMSTDYILGVAVRSVTEQLPDTLTAEERRLAIGAIAGLMEALKGGTRGC